MRYSKRIVKKVKENDHCLFLVFFKIEDEIKGCLDFLRSVYSIFGFSFKLNLSTRPEKFLGDIEVWNQAEKVSVFFSMPECYLTEMNLFQETQASLNG